MRSAAPGWSWVVAIGALVAVSAPAAAHGPSERYSTPLRPAASQSGSQELLCFQNGQVIVSLPSVSDLRVERMPDGRRYSGLWSRSPYGSPEPFNIDAGQGTTCFTSGANRGFFFSG
ncbi:hypothetical protein [Azospirillum sp. SYSU D00513]|uniref:hypothetical protein n=1 Tax=Azospirillum sp. SYSU D00513 TaxID=2812561 RepID=UPI001A96B046|nr:hypothetical protein [Azospirillum sp. SYSU D00513]